MHPAEIVLKQCMGLKDNERVLVLGDTLSESVCVYFMEGAEQVKEDIKCEIDMHIMEPTGAHGKEPAQKIAHLLTKYNIVLLITTYSLSHTDARRNASRLGVRIASMPGITIDIMKRTLAVDYNEIKKRAEQMYAKFKDANYIRILTDKGTELEFKITNRNFLLDTGIYTEDGAFGNLPAGEICCAPVEDSAFGKLVIDGSMAPVGKVNKTTLYFKDGKVVSVEGDGKELLEKEFKKDNTIAEFGIGVNPNAKIVGNVLEDKKADGTIHIAIGDNSFFPEGHHKAQIHYNGIVKDPVVYVDGLLVIDHGKLL